MIFRFLPIIKIGTMMALLAIFCFFFSGCASSDVSRDVAWNIDMGVRNAQSFANSDGDIADLYTNTNQAAKGIVLGGAAGAILGAMSSGIGVVPGTAAGAVLGGSFGAFIDSESTLKDEIINRGIVFVTIGDQILIIIPSARIFEPFSGTIKPRSTRTLFLIACYLNRFTKMTVKIAAYTNDNASSVDLALSRQQAERVARFFVAAGLDARLLYAVGCGGTRPVVSSDLGWDSDNYRIEITTEKLYV